jgi:hypothetical protein
MWLRIIIVVPALLVAGCDPFYGVESRATFPGPVDIRCVNAALASVPHVGRVTYQHSENRSREILPKQRKVVTVMHVWLYGEGGNDILQINQTPDGWDYRNARSRMGVAVPHDEMARFQPLMLKVNRTIQSRCGLPVGTLRPEPVGETKPTEL